ncbi:MAG TPA: chemotaxis protein CheB [Solirubrobacter sp.]|nr:chemotaxis protein CheB [Solirubrobacter sp.]
MEVEPTPQAPAVGVEALPRRVIGVAASAGGVEALRALVAGLPSDLDAALCVVLHIPPTGRSLLAPILDRDGPLRTILAEHGAPLRPRTIYVAPADHHLLVRADTIELSRGPKENGVRPAADPLFRSLARSWGDCAIAVVLSGALDDGAAGAVAVAEAGGEVVVQTPGDAVVPGMPSSTIAVTTPTAVVPVSEMGATLERLVAAPVPNPGREGEVQLEPDPAEMEHGPRRPDGPASGFTCPECSGALWELREGELVRYRCRVGHSYSEDAMVESQRDTVEAALWAALEVLEERGELLRRIAARTGREGRLPRTEHRFREGAREADERAAVIRRVLSQGIGSPGPARADEATEAAAG